MKSCLQNNGAEPDLNFLYSRYSLIKILYRTYYISEVLKLKSI